MARKQCSEIIIVAFLLVLTLFVFLGEAIFSGKALVPAGNIFSQPFYKQFAPSDFTREPNTLLNDQQVMFYPHQYFITQNLHDGEVPLWNPHVLSGVPVNGTSINGLFYPWNLFMSVLPLTVVLWLRAFLNLWIAGFFTFLFVRRIGGSKAGACLSAVSFMFCGFLVAWLGHSQSNAAVWLPLLLYLIELFFTSSCYRTIYALLAAVFMSFVFLAGHMETAFQTGVVCFVYFMLRGFQIQGWHRIARNVALAFGVLSLAVVLAAVQILPFFEWLSLSAELARRSASPFVFFDWYQLKSLPSLIALYLPNFLINPSQIDFPLLGQVPWGNFCETAIYLGILPFIIAVQGLWIKKERHKLLPFFIGVGFFCLFLALQLPIFDWINNLPIFSLFAPKRWRLVFDLFIAVAAGLSLNAWLMHLKSDKNWRRMVIFLIVLGALAVVSVVILNFTLHYFQKTIVNCGQAYAKAQYLATQVHSRPLDQVLADIPIMLNRVMAYFSLVNWRLYFPGLIVIVAAGLIFFWRREWVKLITLKYGIVGLTVLDLFVAGMGYNPTISPQYLFPSTPAIEFLKKDPSIFRILPVRSQWVSSAPMVYGFSDMGGADLPTKYYEEFANAIDGNDAQQYMLVYTVESANSRMIDLMNVKYIVTTKPFKAAANRHIRLCWQQDSVYIYENHNVLPRAFIVHKTKIIKENELGKALKDVSFNPAKEVLLTEKTVTDFEQGRDYTNGGSADVLVYKPKQVTIRVKSFIRGMLVMSDAYYPGWQAYLNKQKVPMYRANGVMRAVEIPAGEHMLEFRYQPVTIYFGAAISVVFFLLVIIGIGVIIMRVSSKRCN